MTRISKIIAAFITLTLLLTTCGCGSKDGSNYVFKYNISANPKTLDPQQADDINSELVIKNVFMGLLQLNADGTLSEGAAESYTVSDDGLKYSFKLRQDVYWADASGYERQCTAQDFVYGFVRLFSKETAAPRASEYYCISKAASFYRGKCDVSELGVKAADDFTLEITLGYANPRFLAMLTEPPAMPCCEEYFLGAQGKYGLSAECTPSNGAFCVKSWVYDPYSITDTNNIILRRNEKNSAGRQVFPSGVNIFIEDDRDFVEDFLNGVTSCIAVTDDDAQRIGNKFGCEVFCDITAGLVFNMKSPAFAKEKFRRALAMLCDREAVAEALDGYDTAVGVVPKEVTVLDKSYREAVGTEAVLKYDPDAAKALYDGMAAKPDGAALTGVRVIVPNSAGGTAVSCVMQEWQRVLGFYCTMEVLDAVEYRSRLASGDFDIALVELTGDYNSPEAYLRRFRMNERENYGSFFAPEFETRMTEASAAADLAESAKLYAKAESVLVESGGFVPLYYKNEFFYTEKDSADLIYNPFTKTVDFSQGKSY